MAYISNTNRNTGFSNFNLNNVRNTGMRNYNQGTITRRLLNVQGRMPTPTFNQDRSRLTIGTQDRGTNPNLNISPVSQGWKDAMKNYSLNESGGLVNTPKASTNSQTNSGASSGLVTTPQTSVPTAPTARAGQTGQDYITQWMNNKYGEGNWNQNPATSPAPATPTSSVRGLVNPPSAVNRSTENLFRKSDASREQERIARQLEEQSRRGEEIGQRAAQISDQYGSEIARVGQLGAGAVAGAKSTGTDVVGRGNAQLASESASNRIASLSAAQTAALQGTQQQLTGAEQGLTGLTNVMQGLNTQQQTGISALGTAGQLAMPSPAQYGQTVFDPLTGTYTGAGGNLDPQMQAQSLAQQVMSGAMTYDQAAASLGYAGNVGTNFLNNAINQAGGNPLQLQAQGAGQQANVATQTTAGTDIARQGLQQATQDYIAMTTAAEFAHTQANAVSNILAQTGLNNISSQDYNRALNTLKGRFSDVNFQSLNTALIEAQAAYTNLLASTGGTPSGREAQAIGTLDINSSAAAINASIQELENAVARRLQAQYGALQQYNQNLGTGATTGGTSGTSGTGASTGGGGFAEVW